VINENDTTATDEVTFGDNDVLAAHVAILLGARFLLLLTDRDEHHRSAAPAVPAVGAAARHARGTQEREGAVAAGAALDMDPRLVGERHSGAGRRPARRPPSPRRAR
jgi:glutamate 5-kinase